MVEIKIEVPNGIVNFLKEFAGYTDEKVKEYLEESVQTQFGSDWTGFEGDPYVFLDLNGLIERFNLTSTSTLKYYIKERKE